MRFLACCFERKGRTAAAVYVALVGAGLFAAPAAGVEAPARGHQRLPVARDTWLSAAPGEQDANLGGADRLKLKGVQEFSLLDVSPSPLRGRVVSAATLRVHLRSEAPLRRVTVSSLAAEWVEGTAPRYREQRGSASFAWAAQGLKPWAWPGSDVTAVMNGQGNTLWRFADASPPDAEGWQTVAVDPAVVAARVAGLSYGFVVFDDVGSEYRRDGDSYSSVPFPNRFVSSREAGAGRAPYFTVVLGPEDRSPPGHVAAIRTEAREAGPGEARLRWVTPEDAGPAGTLGFHVRVGDAGGFDWDHARPVPRYLVPMAGKPGETVALHLRDMGLPEGGRIAVGIRAVDAAGNMGPVATAEVELAGRASTLVLPDAPPVPEGGSAPLPRLGEAEVFVVDALDQVDPVTGTMTPPRRQAYRRANHLWEAAARTVRLHAAQDEAVAFQVVVKGRAAGLRAAVAFDGPDSQAPRPELFAVRYVAGPEGPAADPLLPSDGAFGTRPSVAGLEKQTHASLFVDLYVPKTARPGEHAGRLVIESGEGRLELGIRLRVWSFALPDHLSFVPQMNGYGRVPEADHEREYYRLAQRHRTCLNIVPYGWTGRISDGRAPEWDGRDFSWAEYDRRFGPLLDGSAFSDLPRGAVPIEAVYLPLNENWPVPIDEGFTGGYWADEALRPEYRKRFVEACRRFAEHLREKGWRDTMFEFYLNNKLTHRKDRWSQSSAPWIFDEPANTQDFWALRWYGLAFHEGVGDARDAVRTLFRADISRPQWQRDLLDGVLDVNVVGAAFRRYDRAVANRKSRWGEVAYSYGSASGPGEGGVQPAAWCVEAWARGLDGVVAWQTLGRPSSWEKADPLAIIYPGGAVGRPGPLPSVRLKAFRRGQQDVEYLTILAAVSGVQRHEIGGLALRELRLEGASSNDPADVAAAVRFRDLDPVLLWRLRTRVGALLDTLSVPDRERWAEFSPPKRDLTRLPDLGYARGARRP